MPKISVIVPVYNVKEYLPQCLDSILNQTFRKMEIICVDDGSDDGSGELLDEYAQKNPIICVLHRPNAGYGAAMNTGIAAASGKYIGIVESDDRILPDMYEMLYRAAEKNQADFVKADAYYWFEQCDYLKRIHMKHLDQYYGKVLEENDRNLFFDFFMNIWTGIYRRDFLDKYNIRFQESPGASYQDNGFWMQTMMYAKRAMWLDRAFYMYRNDNPTASVKNPEKIYAMTREYDYLEDLLIQRKDYHLLPYCYYMRLVRDKGTFFRIADEYKMVFCEQIKDDFRKYKSAMRENDWVFTWLKRCVKDTQAVCERVIYLKKQLQKKLQTSKNIIIYGAGVRGDLVFRILYNEKLYDKIACFAVTDNRKATSIAKKNVLFIDDALRQYPDSLVVIAVVRGTTVYGEMKQYLERLHCRNYIDGTDIEENFYVL